MLYNLIFKRETLFTLGLTGLWLLVACFLEIYFGVFTSGMLFHPIVEVVILYLLIGVVSFYFNQVIRSAKLVGSSDFSLTFIATVLLSGLGYSSVSLRFILGFLLLLVLVDKIQKGFNQPEHVVSEFEMGILIGVMTMIYPILIVALPFTFVALVNVKVNTWRGFSALVLGFLFMMVLKWSYFVFTDHDYSIGSIIKLSLKPKSFNIQGLVLQSAMGMLIGIFLVSVNYFMRVSSQLNIKVRVYYKVWLWLGLFLLSGFILLENNMTVPQMLVCVNIPLLVLYTVWVKQLTKVLFKELALLLILLVALFMKIGI